MKNITKGDAQVIEVAMSTLFTDYFAGPSWEKNIVGTGTDSASTMLGKMDLWRNCDNGYTKQNL